MVGRTESAVATLAEVEPQLIANAARIGASGSAAIRG
jgi:hypothetical protein